MRKLQHSNCASRVWPTTDYLFHLKKYDQIFLFRNANGRVEKNEPAHAKTEFQKCNCMKAFVVDRYGSKDGVRAGEMPDPQLREDDVLVQVHAAGVNLLDAKIRDGEFKLILPYRLPLILGNDVAGVVVRVGSRVRRF